MSIKLCDFGCGLYAQHQFKNGKWCCSDHYMKCENYRNKMKGKNNHFFKKKHTQDSKDLISQKKKGKPTWNKNKRNIYSDEYIKKLSDSKKGKPSWNKGILNWMKRESQLARIEKIKGENHWNWKGGISCEPYCEQWRDKEYKESIKERDGHICLNPSCLKNSKNLCIHHIDYNKKNCHPNNLITLCKSCNTIANFNRQWHQEWYKSIIIIRYKKEN